jgi:hypothetical protein
MARPEVRPARGPPATKWFSAGGLDKPEPEIEPQTIRRWVNISLSNKFAKAALIVM